MTSSLQNIAQRFSDFYDLTQFASFIGGPFVDASILHGAFVSIATIVATMALVATIEITIPLHANGKQGRAHLGPNLFLTTLTFATNTIFNSALVLTLLWLQSKNFGIQYWLAIKPWVAVAITVLALDFSFYVVHVAMHKFPRLWRYHMVHHNDPAVDVTTTIRQHPGESIIRYIGLAFTAFAIGASPGAFAIYRVWSALNGLFEHANIRVPRWLDSLLSFITTWPYMHKVHHSRIAHETDTNYGNIFSIWDRLFLTFTTSRRGENISYGLDGYDDRASQSAIGLLALPYRVNPRADQIL